MPQLHEGVETVLASPALMGYPSPPGGMMVGSQVEWIMQSMSGTSDRSRLLTDVQGRAGRWAWVGLEWA